jgi:tetratricopeptide (TPR) repeat protein
MLTRLEARALAAGALALAILCGCRTDPPPADAGAGPLAGDRRAGALPDRLPDDPDLLRRMAASFMEQERFFDAAAVLARLCALAPEDRDSHRLLSDALLEIGDEEGGLAALRKLIERNPDDVEALFTLGGLLASRHADEAASLTEAVALWERYLEKAKDDPHATMVRAALPRIKQRIEKMGENNKADAGVNSP